jgi:hypothetical protein
MPTSNPLNVLKALLAKMPGNEGAINELRNHTFKVVKADLETFLLDLMWEDKQPATELVVAKTSEGVHLNFQGADLAYSGRQQPAKPSLIRWVYENNKPVWITDPDGISPGKDYLNSWAHGTGTEIVIPKGTIWQYVPPKTPMKTEICYPLRVPAGEHGHRCAGVLNIELEHLFASSDRGMRYVDTASGILNSLMCLQHGIDISAGSTDAVLSDLRDMIGATPTDLSPIPKAFISRPMSQPDSDRLTGYIERALNRFGVRCFRGVEAGPINAEVMQQIRASHFGVVVSTGYIENVLLEWGALAGTGKPVIEFSGVLAAGRQRPSMLPSDEVRFELGSKYNYNFIENSIRKALRHHSRPGYPLHGLLPDQF